MPLYGYARVSSEDQDLSIQIEKLKVGRMRNYPFGKADRHNPGKSPRVGNASRVPSAWRHARRDPN